LSGEFLALFSALLWAIASVLMALGGFLAIADRRYRLARRTASAPAGAVAAGD
jgi:hypothetical protein